MNWLLVAPLFLLSAVLIWRRLAATGYSRSATCMIVGCAVLQAIACVGFDAPASMLLAVGMYALCSSAVSLARERNVRGIIRAGGALAAAQIMVPFGGLLTIALVPALVAAPRSADERRKSLGILLLLLFLPAMAAILLSFLHLNLALAPGDPSRGHFFADAAILLFWPAVAIAGLRERQWTNIIPLLSGTALLLAISAGEAMGFGYSPRSLAPAAASILLIAVSQWPMTERRALNAVFLFLASAAVSWLMLVWP